MTSPISIIRIALGVLTDRILTVLSLLMAFSLYCWAMWGPEWERIAIATSFAVLVFLPALIKEKNRDRIESQQASDQGGEHGAS
jgi:hypothetical protein